MCTNTHLLQTHTTHTHTTLHTHYTHYTHYTQCITSISKPGRSSTAPYTGHLQTHIYNILTLHTHSTHYTHTLCYLNLKTWQVFYRHLTLDIYKHTFTTHSLHTHYIHTTLHTHCTHCITSISKPGRSSTGTLHWTSISTPWSKSSSSMYVPSLGLCDPDPDMSELSTNALPSSSINASTTSGARITIYMTKQ